jgi:RsiW-degrading membrane proteinase PrsW (M82 family)|tara:strand:+ start:804 stop:1025 length:222 start_codon:yes stop_codon:yes gene_type:complete
MTEDPLVFLGVVVLFLYLLPYFIARARGHHKKSAIFWINLLLGWTTLVWLILLIYSIFSNSSAPVNDEKRGFN